MRGFRVLEVRLNPTNGTPSAPWANQLLPFDSISPTAVKKNFTSLVMRAASGGSRDEFVAFGNHNALETLLYFGRGVGSAPLLLLINAPLSRI